MQTSFKAFALLPGQPCPRIAAFLPYNQPFYSHGKSTIMEAERINSLAALLQDLTERESQLRGYL